MGLTEMPATVTLQDGRTFHGTAMRCDGDRWWFLPRQAVRIENCEFGEPVGGASHADEQREYEIEFAEIGGVFVCESGEGCGWTAIPVLDAPFARFRVPRDMPEPACAALRRWLADRITIEKC